MKSKQLYALETASKLNVIDRCFNPACSKGLRYLREGRVVRVVKSGTDQANSPEIEHYWLCGHCFQSHDFVFDGDGTVRLGTRFHTFIHASESPSDVAA